MGKKDSARKQARAAAGEEVGGSVRRQFLVAGAAIVVPFIGLAVAASLGGGGAAAPKSKPAELAATNPLQDALSTLESKVAKAATPATPPDPDEDARLEMQNARMLAWKRTAATRKAAKAEPTLEKVLDWLNATRDMEIVAKQHDAPEDIMRTLAREQAKIYMFWIGWGDILRPEFRTLLAEPAAAELPKYLADATAFPNCCEDYFCTSSQVRLALLLKELDGGDHARADVQLAAFKSASKEGAPCRGLQFGSLKATELYGPINDHFPKEFAHVAQVDRGFWRTEDVPVAALLQEHAQVLVAELEKILPGRGGDAEFSAWVPASNADGAGPGADALTEGGADKGEDWGSLTLFDADGWREDLCAAAPKTCELLRDRPELNGRLRSRLADEKNGETPVVQMSAVVIYRLKAGAHLHRHVGNPWRLNIHLGIITPPGAELRCWEEVRSWERARVLVFTDLAEHEAFNRASEDRFILDVMVWHPGVLEERAKNPAFNALFEDT